jgi:hypothetical protein
VLLNFNKILNAEECDATGDAKSDESGANKIKKPAGKTTSELTGTKKTTIPITKR